MLRRASLVLQPQQRPAAAVGGLHARNADRSGNRGHRSEQRCRRMERSQLSVIRAVARTRSTSPTGSPRAAPTGRPSTSASSRSGKELPDVIRWVKFSSLSWTKDGKGFFYGRYPEPPAGKALEAARQGQEDLLPRARHGAVGRPPDLRAAGRADAVHRRRARRDRPVPVRSRRTRARATRTSCSSRTSATRWRRSSTRRSARCIRITPRPTTRSAS